MRRRGGALLLLSACGRVNFAELRDAGADTPCTWSPPAPLGALNSARNEAEPALSPDGTMIVFTSDRLGGPDRLFAAQRQGTDWSAPTVILESGAGDSGPAWNAAGDRLYFSSYRDGPLRFFVVAYGAGGFGTPGLVPGLEALAESTAPTVRADELEMFFSSRLPPSRIERATRPSLAAPWQPQGPVPELAGEMDRGYPGISGDGRTLYFEETRGEAFHIQRARRESVAAPFGAASPVTELDGDNSDGDPQVAFSDRELVLASNRGTPENFDLYIATRTCP